MTMKREYDELLEEYVSELRKAKEGADEWWRDLQDQHAAGASALAPDELWPMGPVSHPRVIAVYRTYFFRCAELNARQDAARPADRDDATPREEDWGVDEDPPAATVEPKTFVLDLLAGGETNDLYEFLLSLVLVPIGIKGDELV